MRVFKHSVGVMLLFLLILIFILITSCSSGELIPVYRSQMNESIQEGTISGKVAPPEAGIRVRAIQNLSLVAETVTDSKGNYKITGLEASSSYGLLFTRGGVVYVYNDELLNGKNHEESLEKKVKEPIQPNSIDVNIDLGTEMADYFADRILVQFKQNISEDKVHEIAKTHNSSINEKIEWSWGDISYVLNIPHYKTVLEVMRDLSSNQDVEYAEEDGVVQTG